MIFSLHISLEYCVPSIIHVNDCILIVSSSSLVFSVVLLLSIVFLFCLLNAAKKCFGEAYNLSKGRLLFVLSNFVVNLTTSSKHQKTRKLDCFLFMEVHLCSFTNYSISYIVMLHYQCNAGLLLIF